MQKKTYSLETWGSFGRYSLHASIVYSLHILRICIYAASLALAFQSILYKQIDINQKHSSTAVVINVTAPCANTNTITNVISGH